MTMEKPGTIIIYVSEYEKGRKDSAELFREAAVRYAGPEAARWTVRTGEKGKPYFQDVTHVHFNISHSGCYWMCAFSDRPVGLDVQKIGATPRGRLAARFFHPGEVAYLEGMAEDAFYSVWAAKESFVKYTGTGIAGNFGAFSTVAENGVFPVAPNAEIRIGRWAEDYVFCLCAEVIRGVKIIEL